MSLHYFCRHCGVEIGTIEEPIVNANNLGFNLLTVEERKDMISYELDGTIKVKSICENCQEALAHNPDLHLLDHMIQ